MKIIQNKYPILVLASVATLLFGFFMLTTPVQAATEGCYSRSFTAERLTYSEVECPSSLQADVDDPAQMNCYVTTKASTNAADFDPTPCDSFEVGTIDTSAGAQSRSGAGAMVTEIDDAVDADCTADKLDSTNCGIIEYLVIFINVLSAIAGMVIVGSMMIAGFQYMTARDNSAQIMKAKVRIVWAVVALALYVFMYALLNFLVPGGVI